MLPSSEHQVEEYSIEGSYIIDYWTYSGIHSILLKIVLSFHLCLTQ